MVNNSTNINKTTNHLSSEHKRVMVFNATFNNISAIPWRSVLFMGETGRKPPTCRKSLTNLIT
jgi:hypothetical protein